MAGRSNFQGMFIGGFQPFFKFRLNSQPTDGKILSSSSSVDTVTNNLDVTLTETEFTSAVTGTQYKINAVVEYFIETGEIPIVHFSSSNENVATINSAGDVNYIADGNATITGTSEPSERTGTISTAQLSLSFSTSGGNTTVTTTISPDPINVSEHVLVLWNSNVADSTTCKNYYLSNRPEFGTYGGGNTPNTLDVPCTTSGIDGFETITESNFNSQIRTPVLNWISSNPSKNIRYIILMYGMPSRLSSNGSSVQYKLFKALQDTSSRTGTEYRNVSDQFSLYKYQGSTALISSLNTGTLADAQAYIDKIKDIYDGMAVPNIIVSASENNQGGDSYYLDDSDRIHSFSKPGNDARLAILEENPSANITYSGDPADTNPTPDQNDNITSASNVSGYSTWGRNADLGGNYANDGTVTFTGNSNWYIIRTIESFNGRRSTFQENIQGWFASNAFGGTSYANTPVFAVSHTEEPFLSGVNDGEFFGMWEAEDTSGPAFLAIEAAWSSRNTPYFQCLGDPLVKR